IAAGCPLAAGLLEDGAADRSGEMFPSVVRMYMDRVQPDILAVENAQASGDDPAVVPDVGADRILRDRAVHRRHDLTVHDVCGALERKEPFDPALRDRISD